MLKSVRLLILDCDGVLIRSRRANLAYYNHLFELVRLPTVPESDEATVSLLHTLSTPQVIETLFPAELRPAAQAAASAVDYRRFLPLVDAEPGWSEVLPRLRAAFPIAVATNRGASALDVLGAAGILEYLDAVVTIRDVKRPKPDPELLFHALRRFGVSAEEALYVGDSELDRIAAAAAGVRFVGFRFAGVRSVGSPWELERLLSEGLDLRETSA